MSPTPTPSVRRSAVALLVAGALAVGACASSGTGVSQDTSNDRSRTQNRAPDEFGTPSGDELRRSGNVDAAVAAYERELSDRPDSAVLREKLNAARLTAARHHAKAALDAADRGDAVKSSAHLVTAERHAAGAPVVVRARQELDKRLGAALRAEELMDEARAVLRTDPERAEDLLAEARGLAPNDMEVVRLLRAATLRAEASRAVLRSQEAWAAGDRATAIRHLNGAKIGDEFTGSARIARTFFARDLLREAQDGDLTAARQAYDTAREIDAAPGATSLIRDEVVAKLEARAAELIDAGRPALAALHETEAKRLGSTSATPALDAIGDIARVDIAIAPFDDQTGGDVDGLRLARALAERLESESARGDLAINVIGPGDDFEKRLAAYPRALRLTGDVTASRGAVGPRNAQDRSVRVQVGTRTEDNPALVEAAAALEQNRNDKAEARRRLDDAEEVLRRIRAAPFTRGESGRIREGRVSLELAIRRAEARVEAIKRELARLEDEGLDLRQLIASTPPTIEVPQFGNRTIAVTEFVKVATVTVHVRIAQRDEVFFSEDMSGSAQHEETVSTGIPDAGVEADPDEAPNDVVMARLAAENFAGLAVGRIRTAAERAARRFLIDARSAERAGQREAAAESYSLYLLATPNVVTPTRADAAKAVRELTGYTPQLRTGEARATR